MKKHLLLIAIIALAFLLRIPALDKYPAGLNADEAAIGYNVYSLLQTGKDEHGAVWPLVFRSFDDYKPGGYFYFVLPFVAVLGLTPLAVRLPSALLGVVSVYFVYLLVNQLFKSKSKISPGLIAALLLAISPWHLHFSRGGWEANAASVLMLIGLYYLLKSLDNIKYFFVSVILFVISLYTYHSLRVVLPLIFIAFLVIYFKKITPLVKTPKSFRLIAAGCLLGFVLLLPLAYQFVTPAGRSRFTGVSVFADQGPLWEALELRRGHPEGSLFAKVFHSRYVTYSVRFGQNYLSHFSPRFLYIVGDEIARSKVPGMGQAYLWTAPFFIIGLLILLSRGGAPGSLIISWLLIAPLAAALTFQSPHALRAQNMVYPLTIITALGLFESIKFIAAQRLKFLTYGFCFAISLLGLYEFGRYLHEYYVHYPKELPYAWQYGFDQIATYVKTNYDKYDHIIITDRYDQPYILMAFFMKLPPQELQKAVLTPRDQFGFSTINNLDKMEFKHINYDADKKSGKTLLILADEPAPLDQAIYTIKDPAGNVMYRFYETQ